MIEVIINGTKIDLISKGVKYTKQANDLADVSTVNTSFTYGLRADKTPKNTQLFQLLGIVGDTSTIPYNKNTVQLIDNGAVLIEKGTVTVTETNSEYKLFLQDGIIEIFKAIENKSLGIDLQLPDLVHNKTAQTIVDSWLGLTKYRYLVADYNGKTNEGNTIDAQYQIPSVNVKYLWDKMFKYLGYSYTGDLNFINNKWITYPKPPEILEEEIITFFTGITPNYNGGLNDAYKKWNITGPDPLSDAIVINKWIVKVNVTGNYKLVFYGTGEMEYKSGPLTANLPFRINLLINGEIKDFILSTGFNEDKFYADVLQADTTIQLEVAPLKAEDLVTLNIEDNYTKYVLESGNYSINSLTMEGLYLRVDNTAREIIDFKSVLSSFSMKDFFKEIMFRGSLTPFVDNLNRNIDFLSLKDRLNTSKANVIDLSSKVITRTNERYSFDSYAQKNTLKLKYNNIEDNYHNGSLYLSNKNLPDEKILFESRFYATDKDPVNLTVSTSSTTITPLIKMWDQKVVTNNGAFQAIEYKPLNNRFYYLTSETVHGNITVNDVTVNIYQKASTKGTTMPEVLNTKYNQSDKIFTDTRIHEIDLLLSAYDFKILDLKKVYYIEQEGQFYLLNKVMWESGKTAKGEFLRIKK